MHFLSPFSDSSLDFHGSNDKEVGEDVGAAGEGPSAAAEAREEEGAKRGRRGGSSSAAD